MSTWIKLHDDLTGNPKVLAAGEDAAWVYVSGLLYCSRHLTDGRIPTAALRVITGRKDARTLARILVREGLWTETASGWEVHEYLMHQRSREQIVKEREGTRNRVAAFRERKRNGAGNGRVTEPEVETETDNPSPTPPPIEVVTPIDHGRVLENVRAIAVDDVKTFERSIDPVQVERVRELKGQLRPAPPVADRQLPCHPSGTPQTNDQGAAT